MTIFSAHRFKIIGFDMLIMSCRVILPKRSSDIESFLEKSAFSG